VLPICVLDRVVTHASPNLVVYGHNITCRPKAWNESIVLLVIIARCGVPQHVGRGLLRSAARQAAFDIGISAGAWSMFSTSARSNRFASEKFHSPAHSLCTALGSCPNLILDRILSFTATLRRGAPWPLAYCAFTACSTASPSSLVQTSMRWESGGGPPRGGLRRGLLTGASTDIALRDGCDDNPPDELPDGEEHATSRTQAFRWLS